MCVGLVNPTSSYCRSSYIAASVCMQTTAPVLLKPCAIHIWNTLPSYITQYSYIAQYSYIELYNSLVGF